MQANTLRVLALLVHTPKVNEPHIIQKETMRQTSPIIIILLALAACFTATPKAQAQSVAVKTNLLYDATLTSKRFEDGAIIDIEGGAADEAGAEGCLEGFVLRHFPP